MALGCGFQFTTSDTPPGNYLVTVTANSTQAAKPVSHLTYIHVEVALR